MNIMHNKYNLREYDHIKNAKSGTWIFMEDFNIVRCSEERFNSQFCAQSAFAFIRLIHEVGLIDLRIGNTYLLTFALKSLN